MAAGDLYDAHNVKVGNAFAGLAPGDTPIPVAPTVLWAAFASPYISAGATDEGWKIGGDTSTEEITIEEQSTSVGRTVTSRTLTIEAALAEDTLASWRLGFGGGTVVHDSTLKTDTFSLSDDITEFAIVLEMAGGLTVGGKHKVRRVYVPRVVAAGNVEISFRRAAAKRLIPVTFTSICAPEEIVIIDYELTT